MPELFVIHTFIISKDPFLGMVCLALARTKWAVLVFSWTAGVMYSTLFTMPYLLVTQYLHVRIWKYIFHVATGGSLSWDRHHQLWGLLVPKTDSQPALLYQGQPVQLQWGGSKEDGGWHWRHYQWSGMRSIMSILSYHKVSFVNTFIWSRSEA